MTGTTLKEIDRLSIGDNIVFYNNETGHTIEYTLKKSDCRNQYFCNCPSTDNDLIFKFLKINKQNFQERVLGYKEEGQFPYCHTLEHMKEMLRKLWKLYYQEVWESLNYNILCSWPKTMKLMCKMQMEQGNPVNPTLFIKYFAEDKKHGGFDWEDTPDKYKGLFSPLSETEPEDRDEKLAEYLISESKPIEKETITIKTKHHAIKLQDKKASVRRGNFPDGSRKRGKESRTAIVRGYLRNRVCHS